MLASTCILFLLGCTNSSRIDEFAQTLVSRPIKIPYEQLDMRLCPHFSDTIIENRNETDAQMFYYIMLYHDMQLHE